jgi:hypothetical protein
MPQMTQGVIDTVRGWTGQAPLSCPWRAYADPLVTRTMVAYPHWRRGQLDVIEPYASHRLVQAISLYDHMLGICNEKWREQAEKAVK